MDEYYKPDKILENTDSVIFFESSSTNDRKVHIGELWQFLAYLNKGIENKSNIYFVLFLCGTSKYPPKVDKEFKRLRYYYQEYTIKESELKKLKGIYIMNQNDVNIAELTIEKIKTFKRIDEENTI